MLYSRPALLPQDTFEGFIAPETAELQLISLKAIRFKLSFRVKSCPSKHEKVAFPLRAVTINPLKRNKNIIINFDDMFLLVKMELLENLLLLRTFLAGEHANIIESAWRHSKNGPVGCKRSYCWLLPDCFINNGGWGWVRFPFKYTRHPANCQPNHYHRTAHCT